MAKFKINPFTGTLDRVLSNGEVESIASLANRLKDPVTTFSNLPITGNTESDLRVVQDTDQIYVWGISATSGVVTDWKNSGLSTTAWGSIAGTLADQLDLNTALAGKSDTGHGHIVADVTDLQSDLDTKIDKLVNIDNSFTLFQGNGDNLIDNTGRHTINLANNAIIDNVTFQFGTGSFRLPQTIGSFVDFGSLPNDFSMSNDLSKNKTMSFWIRRTNTIDSGVFRLSDAVSLCQFTGITSSLRFTTSGGVSIQTSDMGLGSWHHILIVRVGTQYGIYLDGTLQGSQSNGATLLSSGDFSIGRDTTTHFNGNIDDFNVIEGNPFNADPTMGGDTVTIPTDHLNLFTSTDEIFMAEANEDGSLARTDLKQENVRQKTIQFLIDGAGSTIATGVAGWIRIPFDVTLNSARLLAGSTGNIQIDINKEAFSTHNPASANSITAGNPLILSGTDKVEDTNLTGWDTSLKKGDLIYFEVDSITTIQKCLIELDITQ